MCSFPTTIKTLLLAAAIAAVAVDPTECYGFNFPIFTTNNQLNLKLSGDAYFFKDYIQLTWGVQGALIANAHGRVVYNHPFRLKNNHKIASFYTTFALFIAPQTFPIGGEGLAFILAADATSPAHSDGQWLGIVNASTNGAPQAQIMAVEFDTRKNFRQDIDSNHVGLNVNSVFSIAQRPLLEFGVNLSSLEFVYGMVKYDGENISISVSMSNKTEDLLKNTVIHQPLNLSFLPDEVYVGFSGSTSDFMQLNCVSSWEFYGTDIDGGGRNNRFWILLTVAVAGFGAVVGTVITFWARKRRQLNFQIEACEGIEHQLQDISMAQKFELRELKKATDNFDPKNKLGRGGFGTVYKGILINKEVAIKRISKDSRQGKQEFIAEVATIGSLHHKNLIKLTGWCYEKTDLLLVYEYMPNGSLDKLIFGHSEINGIESAAPDWETRRNIIYGVAEALDYLHNGCEKTVLHRDIKSSNIMLDLKFEAKLGDFGLARTIRRTEQTHHSTREIAGTLGYMAPEIFLTSRATRETDVYAFGVLILEVVCGRKPGVPFELGGDNGSLAHWAWEYHKEGKIVEAVDRRIERQFIKEEMENLLILGLACCQPSHLQRPTMKNILQVIKGEANPPIIPNERPSFIWPPIPLLFGEDPNNTVTKGQFSQITELIGR